MRAPALCLLCLLAPAAASAARVEAPDAPVRLSLEGGLAWFATWPDESPGPALAARARVQLLDELALSLAAIGSDQALDGPGRFRNLVAPLALDLRPDRLAIAPYLSAGVALVHTDVSGTSATGFGPSLGFGVEAVLGGGTSLSVQATYVGFSRLRESFPALSSITAGLSLGL